MAKAVVENVPDGEGRNPGEQIGLDTRVVLGVTMPVKCCIGHEPLRCCSESDKRAAWEVRSQD